MSTSLPHPSTSDGPQCSGMVYHWRSRRLTLSLVFTGCGCEWECRKRSSSRSPCELIGRSVVTPRSSRAPPTSLLRTDSSPQSPTVCSFLLLDFLLSVAAPFLSLVLVYGTICRRTLPRRRRCSHLSSDWKCTYFALITLLVPGTIIC